MRRTQTIILSTLIALIGYASCWAVDLDQRTSFNIPAQKLSTALLQFSQQSEIQVATPGTDLSGLETSGIFGTYSVREALERLLKGSGLKFQITGATSIAIGKFDSSGRERPTAAVEGTSDRDKIEEIIVTAQKKSERLQDVPVPVTALDADTLADRDQNRLQDYFAAVPGLSLIGSGTGQQQLAIRGITTGGAGGPTVGLTIDGVPFGSSTNLGNGENQYPDIDPSDLARIEVLRGPQGTLYGASSMGGLINFVTKDPSTDGFSGRVQVLGDDVERGEVGYGFRAAVNVPLSDTFAIRASGFTRRDPGYTDNVLTGQGDVNRVDVYGGRLSALWRPSDAFSLKFSALLQNTDGGGPSTVDSNALLQPTLGDLQQKGLRGTGAFSTETRLYSATLTAKLGGLDFISISGYGTNKYLQTEDFSGSPFYRSQAQNLFGVSGAFFEATWDTNKFTQEFRLSSASGQSVEWLVGAFYTHERSPIDEFAGAIDPASGSQAGVIEDFKFPSTLSEYGLFGDLTAHFTDRFAVQFGGRESENRQVLNDTASGPLTLAFYRSPSPFVNQTEHTNGNAFTYLLSPQFKISPDLMVYARFTSGYRVGGPNLDAVRQQIPIQYGADKTNNYELGLKGDLFDRALIFDASAYYIDWKNVQITLLKATGGAYVANAGDAKSQGLELSIQARPAKGLTITAATSVNDAKLTQNIPAAATAYGLAGDRLPYSSRFSGSLALDQDILLTRNWTGFVGGSLSYVGARESDFAGSATQARQVYPAYADMDLRTGARYESWTVNLFVTNIADKRGVVGGGPAVSETPYNVLYIQPRTAGMSLSRKF